MMMCEEVSRAKVVLAGPTAQNPHLLAWNQKNTLDTTITEEKIWKTHNAFFFSPSHFSATELKKKKQKSFSLRHLLLASVFYDCCTERFSV